jgi:hypothetical protein
MVSKFNERKLKPRSLFELITNRYSFRVHELEQENKELSKKLEVTQGDLKRMILAYDLLRKVLERQ